MKLPIPLGLAGSTLNLTVPEDEFRIATIGGRHVMSIGAALVRERGDSRIGRHGHLDAGQRFGKVNLAGKPRRGFAKIRQLVQQFEFVALPLRQ